VYFGVFLVIGGGVGVSQTGKQRSGEPKWRRAARLGAPVGSRRGATGPATVVADGGCLSTCSAAATPLLDTAFDVANAE
jgi:hypothetical protein